MDGGLKCVVYGPEGIGKTTFAAQFPCPVFIDTEGSTRHMDVMRTDRPQSFAMLVTQTQYFRDNPETCDTLVIDTADWAEQLCMTAICKKYDKKGIEDFGYGKGYVYLREEFGALLNLLDEIAGRGVNVVVNAHAKMRKFEQPDELGAYDRWELKLDKNTAPLLKEWADLVLFANYKTTVVNVDGQGAVKGRNKVQGGKRVMYTTHNPCWDAKNRHGLAEELPFEYAQIAHIVPCRTAGEHVGSQAASEPQPAAQPQAPATAPAAPQPAAPEPRRDNGEDSAIPQALRELMEANQVTEAELRRAVSGKGYFPANMPVSKYPRDFIDNALIATWDRVYAMVIGQRAEDAQKAMQDQHIIDNSNGTPF